MSIGEKIKKARKENLFSQEMLAEKLGVSVQAVSKWECGLNYPDILYLPQIADYLNISLDELLRENFEGKKEFIAQSIPDDGKLRIFAAVGQKIVQEESENGAISVSDLIIRLSNVISEENGSIELHVLGNASIEGPVAGAVIANNNLDVKGNVDGSVNAGNNINIEGNVGGSVNAGNNITVEGSAGGSINAGNDVRVGE